MSSQTNSAIAETHTTWLSGAVLTFVNKLVLPVIWLVALAGVTIWVYLTMGRISIRSDFQFIVWLVGYNDRELVVANYWREARIPFESVEAVEPVWWYKGRLVRIVFNCRTPFGSVIYYMPKWGPFRAVFSAPEQELRKILAAKI
jgi:hypothetical protein